MVCALAHAASSAGDTLCGHTGVLQNPIRVCLRLNGAFGVGTSSSSLKTSASILRSSTERAKNPKVSHVMLQNANPSREMDPHVGCKGNQHREPIRRIGFGGEVKNKANLTLKAYTPLKDPGRTILPTVCVPKATGTWKSATAAADPDDEPPGVLLASWGLRVRGPSVVAANSVVSVFPRSRAPDERSVMIGLASILTGSWLANKGEL